MTKSEDGTIGFGNSHKIAIYFKGIFQVRLATDSDPSDEKRGSAGWTFAHTGEPDLDRIIRFNRPIFERQCADKVGVTVIRVNIDGSDVKDSLMGKMVNLGTTSFFDGSSNRGDGFEPIVNFQFNIGDNSDYILGEANDPPQGSGVTVISKELEKELLIDDMESWRNTRIKCLKDIQSSTGGNSDMAQNERIEKITLLKTIRDYALRFIVPYHGVVDKNLYLDPQDSVVVRTIRDANIKQLYFNADFYSYDGDGLIGHVRGSVSATFTK